jgi:hypothetical protein
MISGNKQVSLQINEIFQLSFFREYLLLDFEDKKKEKFIFYFIKERHQNVVNFDVIFFLVILNLI